MRWIIVAASSLIVQPLCVCGTAALLTFALPSTLAHALSTRLLIAPTGEAADDNYGLAVSGAGDVNGDGFADVIVGAYKNGAVDVWAGRAYVYYGGPAADAIPDLVFSGEALGDLFGASVGGAGDVNGDGFADLIVGAFGNSAVDTSAGRAYVHYGGPAADATADLILSGEMKRDAFGIAVAGAGDVNGDGFADMIVGAPFNDSTSAIVGRAYIYFGGPSADNAADRTYAGLVGDWFGRSVAGAGDVNGDGFADVIIGAPRNDFVGHNAGRAYIYFGGHPAHDPRYLILNGEAERDNFGRSVAGAGDVNGDGYDDVIVGAYLSGAMGIAAGRAYVYFGGEMVDPVPDLIFSDETPRALFGFDVAGGGDVNNDGFGDVVVNSRASEGSVYLFLGGPSPDAVADHIYSSESTLEGFGTAVSFAGDVNGDGTGDLIVGAPFNNEVAAVAGRAYVYATEPDLPTPALLSIARAEVDDGVARVSWLTATGRNSQWNLYRSTEFRSWEFITTLAPDGAGFIEYVDSDVVPGQRFGYRLSLSSDADSYFGEVWVAVPRWALDLRGMVPNPSTSGQLKIGFTLPSAKPATVTVLDLTGRLIFSRNVGVLGPGHHILNLDGTMPPGLFFVRLEQGSRRLMTKAVVVR